MHLYIWMGVRLVKSTTSTSLGSGVEVKMVPSSGEVEGVLLVYTIVRRSVMADLEDGTAIGVHDSILVWLDGSTGLQVVT
jgi:hypothetical protein